MIIKKYLNEVNQRLDKYIKENLLAEESRAFIIKKIKSEDIIVNGNKVKAGHILKYGDEIQIKETKKTLLDVLPQNIPIEILYEDEDILVVNKERGMVVHPGNGNSEGTLVNAIMYHCKDDLSDINGVIRPGIVHRIDKNTSGVLVIAKNNKSHKFLAKEFKAHTIDREYVAICDGVLPYDKIKIDKPIGRSKKDRIRFDIDTNLGKDAVTHIMVLERFKSATYLIAKLETGRTHQIRVHMKSIGHPIIGDDLYFHRRDDIKGQALHARKLGFIHPRTKKEMVFESKLPKDFTKILDEYRKMVD